MVTLQCWHFPRGHESACLRLVQYRSRLPPLDRPQISEEIRQSLSVRDRMVSSKFKENQLSFSRYFLGLTSRLIGCAIQSARLTMICHVAKLMVFRASRSCLETTKSLFAKDMSGHGTREGHGKPRRIHVPRNYQGSSDTGDASSDSILICSFEQRSLSRRR